ncbi:hypothetical protein [Flexivirga sp.]|uniref:hypothetical protein n=1 Tax=Flexivirga sp. TaxID=1962927 RepID=UPI003F7CEBBF
MTPEERAHRKAAREKAERARIRETGAAKARQMVAERGHIPDQLLQEVVRPAVVEGVQRANRSKRHPA